MIIGEAKAKGLHSRAPKGTYSGPKKCENCGGKRAQRAGLCCECFKDKYGISTTEAIRRGLHGRYEQESKHTIAARGLKQAAKAAPHEAPVVTEAENREHFECGGLTEPDRSRVGYFLHPVPPIDGATGVTAEEKYTLAHITADDVIESVAAGALAPQPLVHTGLLADSIRFIGQACSDHDLNLTSDEYAAIVASIYTQLAPKAV
jgi:hypothetical protein